MSSQKGARSKLADVLADIKSSRIEDEYDYNNHDITPTPAKRRSAVNYVALSGHTPRSSRSSNAHANSSHSSQQNHEVKTASNNTSSNNKSSAQQQASNATTNSSTTRTRTYILKLFDRTVDLAQFTEDKNCDDSPLYPVCRAWVHGHRSGHTSQHNKSETPPTTTQISSTVEQPTTEKNNNESSPSATQQQDSLLTEAASLEVHSMPPPKSKLEIMKRMKLNTDNVTESTDIRIPPSVRDFKPQENVAEMIDKSIKSMDHQECMNLNRLRWKKVRQEWSESRRTHEARYEESFKILHGMFAQQRGI